MIHRTVTIALALAVAAGLGYCCAVHRSLQRQAAPAAAPATAPKCSCRGSRLVPPRMPAIGCDCEDCPCEQEGQCVKPDRCPNVHGLPKPSLN